jgi:hypothetical protein
MLRNYGSTWLIVAIGAIELVWDLSWANWATNWELQFARHSSCKPVLRQVLEMVAGARYVPNRQFLSIPFRSELVHCAM